MGPHLIGTAGVKDSNLRGTNAATTRVLANAIGKVVVSSTERVCAVVTHPRTASTSRDLKADTVVGRRVRRDDARTCIGNEKGGGNGEQTQKHSYKYNSPRRF